MKNELISKYSNQSEDKRKETIKKKGKISNLINIPSLLRDIRILWEEKRIPKFYQELINSFFEYCIKMKINIFDDLKREKESIENNSSTIQVLRRLQLKFNFQF